MPTALLDEPQRITYPARFEEIPIDTEFTTDAAPRLTFRKSTNGRGECVTEGKRHRSQFFQTNAPVKPIGWTRPERMDGPNDDTDVSEDGGGDDAELAKPAGVSAVKQAVNQQNPANGTGGQRTPRASGSTGPKGAGGQSTVDSSDI
jgi:hypothetical protein